MVHDISPIGVSRRSACAGASWIDEAGRICARFSTNMGAVHIGQFYENTRLSIASPDTRVDS